MIDIDFIIIFMIRNNNCTLYAIFHWNTMMTVYLSCFTLKWHISFFFSQISNSWFIGILCQNVSKQLKNHINFNFQYWSTKKFEVTQLPLHKEESTKQRINIMGQPIVANLNLKSDVDRPASGKLGQSTTVPSQCDQLS